MPALPVRTHWINSVGQKETSRWEGGCLLAEDALAPSRFQRRHLSRCVLIVRGNAGVTDQHCTDARPERRLGHVLEDELGLEDPTEIAVRAIKAVLRTEPGETSQGDRGGGVSGFKRGVEMTEPIPLVGDP